MAVALTPQDNTISGLGSILNAIPGLSDAINGKTTTTSNSGISSDGMSALLSQILGSTQGLASVAGGQNTAGLYNSTVQQQSVNDLLTRSAGEVATKGPTTTTAVQAPSINLGQTLLTGAAGLVGTHLLSAGTKSLGSSVASLLGFGSTAAPITDATFAAGVPGAAATSGAFTAPAAAGLDASLAGTAGAGSIGAGASLSSALAGAGISGLGAAGGGLLGSGLAGAVGLGSDAALGGLAAAGGGTALAGLGGALAGDVAASTAGIAAASGVGAAGAAAAGGGLASSLAPIAAALAWVVCTELESIGEMDAKTYTKAAPDFIHRMHLKPSAVRGYHYWAIPYTRLMRRKDWIGSLARKCMKPIAVGRAEMINGKPNFWGWFSFAVIERVCTVLGNTVARKPQNWKSLYSQKQGEVK